MPDARYVNVALFESIEDQMGFMALNAIRPGKFCPHPVRFRKFGDEPERLMQRSLIGYGLLLTKLMHTLPVNHLQIV